MTKLLGAVLILLGCGGVGFLMVVAIRHQEKALRQLIRALEYMEWELQYRMTPLPELCRGASEMCTGHLKNVFQQLVLELQAQVTPNATACMQAVIVKNEYLPEKVRSGLLLLGDSLGRFDCSGQLQGLRSVQKYAEFELGKILSNQALRLRSYQTLGICAGAALIVLFL